MTEKWVRKSINIKDITKKETYNNNDLDLFEDEKGHVYIRLTHANSTWKEEAYFYELTNAVRSLNKIELTNEAQLENISNLNLPLVMDVQHLVGELQVTIAGNTATTFKVNGQSGTFNNGVTTYAIELSGDTEDIPDLVIKEGNKTLATYETHLPDLEETEAQHPGYILGADSYRTFRTSTRTRLNELEEYHCDLIKDSSNNVIVQLYCQTLPDQVSVFDNETLKYTQTNFVKNSRKLPLSYSLYECNLGTLGANHSITISISGVAVFIKTTV